MKMRKKIRRGFTLVELVVVIAVIAILSAVSVGAYFGITDSANSSNATHGSKQVTDLWYVYSLDRDYNPNASLKEKADDFCLDFMPYNGPDYDVNWKEVTVYTEAVDPSLSVSGLNRIPYEQNSVELPETTSGILFKIETTYPTWFIVIDDKIVEKSETIYKNDNEFLNSIKSSHYVTPESKPIEGLDYNFSIETIGIDENGDAVRGYKVAKFSITDTNDEKELIFLKNGENLKEHEEGQKYVPAYIDNGNISGYGTKIINTDSNIEYDIATTVDISKNDYVITDDKKVEKYTYWVTETNLKIVDLLNKEVSFQNYPVCAVFPELSISDSPVNGEVYYVDLEEDRLYSYRNKITPQIYPMTKSYSHYYFTELDSCLSKISDLRDKLNEAYELGVLIFVGEATIDSDINFPDNVSLVLFNESISSTTESTINEYYERKTIFTNRENQVIQKVKVGKLTGRESNVGNSTNNTQNASAKFGSKNFDTVENLENCGPINYNTKDNFNRESNSIKSNLTITENGSITLGKDSYIFVEGELHSASSAVRMGIGNRGQINNNGEINLNNGSKLRVYGEIIGKGSINLNSGSEALDLFKPDDYYGGTATLNYLNANIFPFNNYQMDGIKNNVNIEYGAVYNSIAIVNVFENNIITPKMSIISKEINSLFVLEPGVSVSKKYDDIKNKTVVNIHNGTVKDGEFTVNLLIEVNKVLSGAGISLPDWIYALGVPEQLEISVSNTTYLCPLSNFEINIGSEINRDAELELSYKKSSSTSYVVMPTVSFNNFGTLSIKNGTSLSFLSADDITNLINSSHDVAHDKTWNQLKGISQSYFINNGSNIVIDKENNSELYINDKELINNLSEQSTITNYSSELVMQYIFTEKHADKTKALLQYLFSAGQKPTVANYPINSYAKANE